MTGGSHTTLTPGWSATLFAMLTCRRELTAVTETGSKLDVIWATQAIDTPITLKDAAGAACEADQGGIDPALLDR